MPSITLDITLIKYIEPRLWTLPLATRSLRAKELVLAVPHVLVIFAATVKHLRVASQVQRRCIVCQRPIIIWKWPINVTAAHELRELTGKWLSEHCALLVDIIGHVAKWNVLTEARASCVRLRLCRALFHGFVGQRQIKIIDASAKVRIHNDINSVRALHAVGVA